MNQELANLGGLDCRVIDDLPAGRQPKLIVILCHGFGAPGTDLVALGPELLGLNPDLTDRVRFIFPAAPVALEELAMFGGRAWWPLDVARVTAALEADEIRDLSNDLPDEMPEARRMLTRLVEDVMEQTGLPTSRLVLGGFSQGAMLSTDVSLRLPEPPAALCLFSGTLLCEADWRDLAGGNGSFPVLQSHGRQDPLLPFRMAERLRDLLADAGLEVDFLPFDGVHTIPYEALHRFAALLERLAIDGD